MAILHRNEDIKRILAIVPQQGKHLLEPPKDASVKILEDVYVSDNEAEVHDTEKDVWFCLEGRPSFVYGGELVEKRQIKEGEWKGRSILGGVERILRPGDWLEIEAGEPHQHNCPDGVARMVIVKVPAKK